MTRRRLPLLLSAAGLVIILVAVIAAVVVRSTDTATLSLGERPDVPVVITEPGVLDAVDPEVTIRATAGDDEQVVLAIGRTSEVEAWLGDAPHARITGLSSWEELTVEVVPSSEPTDAATGEATAEPTDGATAEEGAQDAGVPDPAGSDLWLAESVGTGSAELTWTDSPGRWSLVAATDGTGPAPEIELEWGRRVSTPWLVPGIVLGGLALVAGLAMLVLEVLAKREQRRREDARARQAAAGDDGSYRSISDTDPGTGERLTRRQIRELEQRMAEEERLLRTGEPPVPLAPGHDAAEHPQDGPADEQTPTAQDTDAGEPTGPVDEQPADEADNAAAEPAAAEPADAEPADDEPAEGEPDADEPDGDEPDDEPPATLSWRSVWGFGSQGTTAPPADDTSDPEDPHPVDDQDSDGEEKR
ncbi:hypothetical protein FE251_12115 [Georgenia wutianyii]|uniref:Uncharacterized protein n=1 Tax=Georgenia wutianyii TaxID=2585135 RepID=A0ABX5VP97_9MICO|nr:hypothetical protein [Georgenia wutianyii]QDB80043.1 hypothetical protein FE251_12115 [Georgenia wutianyii]